MQENMQKEGWHSKSAMIGAATRLGQSTKGVAKAEQRGADPGCRHHAPHSTYLRGRFNVFQLPRRRVGRQLPMTAERRGGRERGDPL